MDKEIISGIYRIRNLETNKSYYGSSNNLEYRKIQHFQMLANNRHQAKLQHSYNLHGKENFIFEIVELILESSENILEVEQRYLDFLRPYEQDIGYNISKSARGGDNRTNNPNIRAIGQKIHDTASGQNHFTKKMTKEELGDWKRTGAKNGMYGTNNYTIWLERYGKEEADRRQIEANKGKVHFGPKIANKKCEWCDRMLTTAHYNRWHGSNCKKKPGNESIKRFFGKEIICLHCNTSVNAGTYTQCHGDNCKLKPGNENIKKHQNSPFCQKRECPPCNKSTNIGNYAKFHGDNCKFRGDQI